MTWTSLDSDVLSNGSWSSADEAALQTDWDQLHPRCRSGLFLSYPWMRFWLSEFGKGAGIEIVRLTANGCSRFIGVLRIRNVGPSYLGIRVAETVGTRYLPFNDVLCEPDAAYDSLDGLVKYLRQERGVDLLRLRAVPAESPISAVVSRLRLYGDAVRRENVACRNRFTDIADIEAFWESRPANLRRDQRAGIQRLSELGRISVSWHGAVTGPIADEYFQLYSRAWQSAESREGVFRRSMELLSSLGALRLMFLRVGACPIAAQLIAVDGQTAYIMKNFYDRQYRKCSPGTIIGFDGIHRAFTVDGARRFDYMKGDEAYKARWMDQVRARFDLLLPLTVKGAAALKAREWLSIVCLTP
jgi:CelD/BcsL family acetyltransferase involved in cellulose biosynthesis